MIVGAVHAKTCVRHHKSARLLPKSHSKFSYMFATNVPKEINCIDCMCCTHHLKHLCFSAYLHDFGRIYCCVFDSTSNGHKTQEKDFFKKISLGDRCTSPLSFPPYYGQRIPVMYLTTPREQDTHPIKDDLWRRTASSRSKHFRKENSFSAQTFFSNLKCQNFRLRPFRPHWQQYFVGGESGMSKRT